MVKVRIGEIALTGRVSGVYNRETKTGEVKRGVTKNDKRYQIFEISVSSKDQQGNWTNGKGLKVMLWGDTKVEIGDNIGMVGRLQPDNYTNQDGKEIRGMMFNAFADSMFEPDSWDNNDNSEPEAKPATDENNPWK